MILIEKRPFCFAVISLVLGEVCGLYGKSRMAFLLCMIGYSIVIKIWERKRILFVFLFLFGICHSQWFSKQFQLPKQYQDGSDIQAMGIVAARQEGTYGTIYRCRNICLIFPENKGKKRVDTLMGDLLLYGGKEGIKLGQQIVFEGKIKTLKEATNPGQFDQKQYQMARGVVGMVQKVQIQKTIGSYHYGLEMLERCKQKLNEQYKTVLSKKNAGLLMAMVTGEKGELEPHVKQLYQQQGIAHILAISGLHIALVGRSLFRLLRKRGVSYWSSGGVAFLFLLLYCTMIGESSSVVRAFVMLSLFLLAEILGRSYDMMTSMSVAACFLILKNPYCMTDTGFLLSFGAIVGIGVCYVRFFQKEEGKEQETKDQETHTQETKEQESIWSMSWNSLKQSFFVSVSVQIVTTPILIHTFYGISLYSLLLNLIVIPLMSVLLPSAMLGGILSIVSLDWGKIVLYPAVCILSLYETLCEWLDHIPHSFYITGEMTIYWYSCYYGVLLLLLLFWKHWDKKKAYCIASISCAMLLLDIPTICSYGLFRVMQYDSNKGQELHIICADVGQGDGLLFRLPSNHIYLLDGGSTTVSQVGTYRLLPMLHYYGITTVDVAIVTHLDADHYNGMMELFDHVTVKVLCLPKLKKKDNEYIQLEQVALQHHTHIYYAKDGDQLKDGDVRLQWISPSQEIQRDDRNDNSQVFYLEYKAFRGLFTGDMSEVRERELLNKLRRCTLLKVGHHGSKTSSSEEFLERVSPRYAFVSYGVGNRYGHPSQEAMQRLKKRGIQTYETGKQGALSLKTDGTKVTLFTFLEERQKWQPK